MKLTKEVLLILVLLMVVYTGITFVQQSSPTGNVVLEWGYLNILGEFSAASGVNVTADGLALQLQENTTWQYYQGFNMTNVVAAWKGSENQTDKVIKVDSKQMTLSSQNTADIYFNDVLQNSDVVTVVSKESSNKGLRICYGGDCSIATTIFNSSTKTYNFTLSNLVQPLSGFLLKTNQTVKVDYVYGLKNNTFSYNLTDYYYPAQADVISGKIGLPELALVHSIQVNTTLQNQSINYQYSTDNVTWVVVTEPLEKTMKQFWLKITLYSNGTNSPVLYGVWVNYSNCIRECFPNKINVNRTALISLMKNETAEVNASFTNIIISPEKLEMNKTFSVTEYQESDKNYSKKQLQRFVDLDSEIANASFTLKMYYNQSYVDENNINESSIKIYYYNETSSEWGALPSVVNENENYAEAALEHLSTYGLFGEGLQEPSGSSDGGSSGGSGGGGGRRSSRTVLGNREISITSTTTISSTSSTIPPQKEVTTTLGLREESDNVQDRGGLFKTMTGRVVDASKRVLKMPNIILFSIITILSITYLLMRVRWIRKKKIEELIKKAGKRY